MNYRYSYFVPLPICLYRGWLQNQVIDVGFIDYLSDHTIKAAWFDKVRVKRNSLPAWKTHLGQVYERKVISGELVKNQED